MFARQGLFCSLILRECKRSTFISQQAFSFFLKKFYDALRGASLLDSACALFPQNANFDETLTEMDAKPVQRSQSSVTIGFAISHEFLAKLRGYAMAHGQTTAFVIRAALIDYLWQRGCYVPTHNPTGKGERSDLREASQAERRAIARRISERTKNL